MKHKILLTLLLLLPLVLQACSSGLNVAEAAQPVIEPPAATVQPIVEAATPLPDPTAAPDTQTTFSSPGIDIQAPLTAVEAFYDWFFDQPMGEVINQRTYEDSPYLSGIMKSDTGYLLDSFKDQSGYDPFTCAQNTLPSLDFGPVFLSGGEASILAQVIIDGQVRHYFVVQASQSEGDWKVDAVQCPHDPKTAVTALYTWYLGYINNGSDVLNRGENFRNPIADGVLTDFFLLSDSYVQDLAMFFAKSSGDVNFDPILNAQDLPVSFWVDPAQDGDTIRVRLVFGPESTRYNTIRLVESPSMYWRIDAIEPVEVEAFDSQAGADVDTSGWMEYKDPDYAFSFRYPRSWKMKSADLSSMPADDPMKKGTFFYPGWAQPNLPVLSVQVLQGTEEQLNNYYVVENRQQVSVQASKIWVDKEQCNTRYIFRHPSLENIWIIVGDTCPTMQGREKYAEELKDVIAPLLNTIVFE